MTEFTLEEVIAKLADYERLEKRNKELRDLLDHYRNATDAVEKRTRDWAGVNLIGRVETADAMYGKRFYIDYGDWDVEITNTESNVDAGLQAGDIVSVVGYITYKGPQGDVEHRLYVKAYKTVRIVASDALPPLEEE